MHDQLLGYLLGALEPAEQTEVETRLVQDPGLRRDLDVLRRGLTPLSADPGHIPSPPGLAVRTCEFVLLRNRLRSLTPLLPWGGAPGGPTGRWSFQDLLVAAGIVMAASLLFFPAVSRSRHFAQAAACQDQLRQLGLAIETYSQHNHGFFPFVPSSGNLAVAGIYAPVLLEGGYIEDERAFLCPASPLASNPQFRIPSFTEFSSAKPCQLSSLRRFVGGSFGYTIGHMLDGHYQGTRNRHRSTFALLSDAPSLHLAGHQSANHGGCGQNVLFEDGHVDYITNCQACGVHDNLFLNGDGQIAPGTNPDDTVIIPSELAPSCWAIPEAAVEGPMF